MIAEQSPLPEKKYPWLNEEISSQSCSSVACCKYGKHTIWLILPTNHRPIKRYEWRFPLPDNAERPAAYLHSTSKSVGTEIHWAEVQEASRDLKPAAH